MSLRELQAAEAMLREAMKDEQRDILVSMSEQTVTITRKDYFELIAKIGTLRKNLLQTVQMVRDNHSALSKIGDSNEAFAIGERYGAMRERAELCAYIEEAEASIQKSITSDNSNQVKNIHFERMALVFQTIFKLLIEHKSYPLNRKVIGMPRWHQGQAFPEFQRLDKGGRDVTTHAVGKKLPTANEISQSMFGSRYDGDEHG